jgi:NadR type nicotinamide-nucleotide adenylyltransferase
VRFLSLAEQYANVKNVSIYHCRRDDLPQNPEDSPDFWNIYRKLIEDVFPEDLSGSFVFASEEYGQNIADLIDGEFVPCNVYRETINIHATDIRKNPRKNWLNLMPAFRKHWQVRATIFGAESTGKTTVSKNIVNSDSSQFYYVPEWAREFLELQKTPETTEARMEIISMAQNAVELCAENFLDKPFIIQDTDLLTTIGFYRLYFGEQVTPGENLARSFFRPADIYFVMPDTIPFTPDKLRYGGDKRESNTRFWINLLEQFNCRWHYVQNTERNRQTYEIMEVLDQVFDQKMSVPALKNFSRE